MSFNGHWQSDAVSAFEVGVEEHFIQNPSFAFKMLSNFSDKDIHSFWYLYFDGPHPPEQTPPEFFEMKKSFPKVFNIMLKALKKVQKDNPHHH